MPFPSYEEIHRIAEKRLCQKFAEKGHAVMAQHRIKNGCIIDVYDATTDTAYEILTAKIVRSAHEQDEAILAKIFRYLTLVKKLKFVLVSFGREDLEMFHSMRIAHEHIYYNWLGAISGTARHRGAAVESVAQRLYDTLVSIAPIHEWTRKGRRNTHPYPLPAELEATTRRLGLPKNFLKGLWRDWRLKWVLQLEEVLPKWRRLRTECLQKLSKG